MRILLVHGGDLVSKLIEWQTRGFWSHAALFFTDNQVIESVSIHGVRQLDFFDWRKPHPGAYRVLNVPVASATETAIRTFAAAQLGKPYDYAGVARFINRSNYAAQPDDKWFCSELVFQAFKEAGIELFARTEGWEVPPQMLNRTTLAA